MEDKIKNLTERFRSERKRAQRYTALLLVLALVTTLFVDWQLHGNAIAVTADYQCGLEEHTHTAACYEKVLVCGYTEGEPEGGVATLPSDDTGMDAGFGVSTGSGDTDLYAAQGSVLVPHEHTDACYEERRVLDCSEEEHTHTDACFDPEDGSLICGKFEHTHDDSCYTTERVLVCGLEEGELVAQPVQDADATQPDSSAAAQEPAQSSPDTAVPVHHHTDACYEEVLVCPLPEHHHTVACLADTQADVETEQDWEAQTDTDLSGNWAEDLLRVAKSQLGYEQSEKNYQLDTEDKSTVRHYTRYGQWYGNPYGEWDVMFLSYCLHYASVPETVVPQRAGVLALRSAMQDSEWLQTAEQVTPQPGDIVFYHAEHAQQTTEPADMDEETAQPQTTTHTVSEETVGIVESVDAEQHTLTVISGDVDGKVAEVTLADTDVTGLIPVAQAHAAQTPAKDPDAARTEEKKEDADTPAEEDDGFRAGIDWIGQAPETGAGPLATQDLAGNEVDLTSYITNAVFRKLVGSNWVDIGENEEIEDGQNIQVKLTYTLQKGVLGNGKNTVVYQLPGGLTLKQAKDDGVIYDAANNKVGTYTISQSGEVRLTFTDPEVLNGAEFEGFFQLEAQTDFSHASEGGSVNFSEKFTLKIKKPTPDIAVNKGLAGSPVSTDANNNFYLSWWVTASTTNGTFDTVRIGDCLNGDAESGSYAGNTANQVLGSYVPDSIRLVKVVNKTETEVSYKPEQLKLVNTGDFKSLTITDLPELKAGEQYKLYYKTVVTPDELDKAALKDVKEYNKAFAGIKGEPDVKLNNAAVVTINRRRITKSVSYNQQTGMLDWTIEVRAPRDELKQYLNGYVVKDTIPAGLTVKDNKITVRAGSGVNATTVKATITPEQLADGYTIQDTTNNVYTFTYSTTLPKAGTTATNTATAAKDGKEFSASASYTTNANAWTLSKKRTNTVNGVATWNLTVNNPAGSGNFTMVDVMEGKTGGKRVDGAHWAIATELQAAIEQNLTLFFVDGTRMNYEQAQNYLTIEYFSDTKGVSGQNVVQPTNSSTKVLSFKITINSPANPVRRVELPGVPTHEDRDKVQVGETREYINYLAIAGVKGNTSDKDSYTRYESFVKEVSTNGTGDNNYNNGSTVDYEEVKDHKLRYRLTLNTDAAQTAPIQLTDTLPQKVNEASNIKDFKVTLDGKDVTSTYKNSWSVDNGVLKVTLNNYNSNGTSHKIVVQYSVLIDADPRWKDLSIKSVEYTNTAKWGDETASTTTTVTREVPVAAKSGEQLKNADGQPTNRVLYTVYINQAGETLNNGVDLTLEDQLSVVSGDSAYGDVSTVKLYYCDIVDGEPTIGAPVPSALYQVLPAEGGSWLRMKLPDHTRLALQYECEIDPGNSNAPELSNQVSINGKWSDPVSNPVSYNSSQASIQMGQLVLNKRDKDSGQMLEGATFAIDAYDAQTRTWNTWGTRTTDTTGKITLSVTASSATSLHPDTLYRITETAAPDNYAKDSTPHYVLFASIGEDFDTAYQKATGVTGDFVDTDGMNVQKATVTQGTAGSTTILNIYNTYNRLTVNKLWLDANNKQTEPAAQEIKVQLYRYTTDPTQKIAVGEPVTLDAKNKWSYTWAGDQVPTDINGVPCYYLVEELTTGNWDVVVRKNGDVQTGEITLCNVVYNGYELPSTGGSGTAGFALLGSALMAAAALGLLARRRKKENT